MSIMRSLDGRAVITRRAGLGLAALALAGGLGLGVPSHPALAQAKPVLVFAAASLKNALDEIAGQYERETGRKVTISYGASSALARQIEAAAPMSPTPDRARPSLNPSGSSTRYGAIQSEKPAAAGRPKAHPAAIAACQASGSAIQFPASPRWTNPTASPPAPPAAASRIASAIKPAPGRSGSR